MRRFNQKGVPFFMNDKIHFSNHTDKYTSGLPIGNGKIAAMVLGSPEKTRFALNHEGLWRTAGKIREVPTRVGNLHDIRDLISNNNYEKATHLAQDSYSRYFEGSQKRIMPYVPAGDLNIIIDAGVVTNYHRSLDLRSGEVFIEFDCSNYGHVEISSFMDHCTMLGHIKILTEKSCPPSLELCRSEDENCSYIVNDTKGRKELLGVLDDELYFLIAVNYASISDNCTTISFGIDVGLDKEKLSVSFDIPDYDLTLMKHKSEFSKLLGKSDISIKFPESDLTTDKRIENLLSEKDITLPILFFNFAKYLMASGSGDYPLNLQGKWNEELTPPWSCDYHLDINLQMNYWFNDVLGMNRANEALFDYCESCIPSARERAKNLYGCRGICFDHASDLWGAMFHDAYGWGTWIGAAPWLAQHFYRHYLYTADIDFLEQRAYPFMCECLDFYEDYTFVKNGKLCISPSCSPENRFTDAGALPISVCEDSAMDISLYRELLIYAIDAAKALGIDQARWQRLLDMTPELKIGSDGRLLEWNKEYQEAEPEHRHLSHLVGLYPGWLVEKNSKLYTACEKSLDYRLSFGGGQTGWSRAWVACLYARLERSDDLWQSIKNLICEQCSTSLLDFHPPIGSYKDKIFQIDGNFGGAAAIAEAFVSVRFNEITLLGACPPAWKSGRITHFKLPYNTDISFDFENGKVTKIELYSPVTHKITIKYPQGSMSIHLKEGEQFEKELC